MSRRRGFLVALVVALGLAVVAAFGLIAYLVFARTSAPPTVESGEIHRPQVVPDPEARQAPEPALQSFYNQTLDWQPCQDGMECAELRVPLDYAKPAKASIEIGVLRKPATSDRIGSLVVNPGGPGASGIDYAAAASRVFGKPLLRAFDIVGFDPRGVGKSAALDCLTDDELDAVVAADPTPDNPTEVEALLASAEQTAAGCKRHSGRLARHVSTHEAARDLDVLRAALDEKKLTYFGASYGTQLGATYADLFPQRAGRVVLDGAVDLALDGKTMAIQQAAGFETALRAYVGYCLDSSDSCFLGDDVDEGMARIQRFLQETEESPLSTDLDGRVLGGGNALYGVITPLYDRGAWSALSTALRQALGGDGTTLLQFSDLYTGRISSGGYESNIFEANLTIVCNDSSERPSLAQVEASLDEFAAAAPTFGPALGWAQVACAGFPVVNSVDWAQVKGAGAPPILVIGTSRDPATPLAWAESLAEQLESGVLVTRDGDGHTGYMSGNECVDDAVEDYLIKGTVPRDGLTC
jgi:pimeloyl-ACP methyl ester carboxylesterase